MLCEVRLQVVLDVQRQTMFQEGADLTTVGTMAITDREEVAMFEAHDVRISYVGVLIHFVRIVS